MHVCDPEKEKSSMLQELVILNAVLKGGRRTLGMRRDETRDTHTGDSWRRQLQLQWDTTKRRKWDGCKNERADHAWQQRSQELHLRGDRSGWSVFGRLACGATFCSEHPIPHRPAPISPCAATRSPRPASLHPSRPIPSALLHHALPPTPSHTSPSTPHSATTPPIAPSLMSLPHAKRKPTQSKCVLHRL